MAEKGDRGLPSEKRRSVNPNGRPTLTALQRVPTRQARLPGDEELTRMGELGLPSKVAGSNTLDERNATRGQCPDFFSEPLRAEFENEARGGRVCVGGGFGCSESFKS